MHGTDLLMAPDWDVTQWFNTGRPLTLASLRGRVVMIEAFQMLCPGCVSHALPQAQKAHKHFGAQGLAVIGLHTVFEHHAAQGPVSLAAFLHEYRMSFPIGVDRLHAEGRLPVTMEAYGMRGTPSTVLIDRAGRLRHHLFGRCEDIVLGGQIAALLAEPAVHCTSEVCEAGVNELPGSYGHF